MFGILTDIVQNIFGELSIKSMHKYQVLSIWTDLCQIYISIYDISQIEGGYSLNV